MSGSQYIALSGLRARIDELDRLAGDLANVGTAGYKGERAARAAAERPTFDRALQTAIDTTSAGARLDMTAGAFATTGRPLDMALDGPGFFTIQTPGGDRYTRNGHFTLNVDRQLVTEDGAMVLGEDGPITLGDGEVTIDQDGTVWTDGTKAGRLAIAEFDDPAALQRENGTRLHAGGQQSRSSESSVVRAGTLEQSNVSMAERMAHLTTISRGFEAMQKAISMVMNDVDGQAIARLSKR